MEEKKTEQPYNIEKRKRTKIGGQIPPNIKSYYEAAMNKSDIGRKKLTNKSMEDPESRAQKQNHISIDN